jgi:AcrR family transcriptional regulator
MKDLGAHAGIGAPAAYNHFPSKDAILVEAVTWAMQGFFTSVTLSDDPSASPETRLERIVVNHVSWQIEHSRLARANDLLISSDLLLRIGERAAHKRIRSMLRAHLDLVTNIVREVLRDRPQSGLEPRLCALAIGSMCDDVIKWFRPDGKYPAAKIAQMYWSLTKRMVGIAPL